MVADSAGPIPHGSSSHLYRRPPEAPPVCSRRNRPSCCCPLQRIFRRNRSTANRAPNRTRLAPSWAELKPHPFHFAFRKRRVGLLPDSDRTHLAIAECDIQLFVRRLDAAVALGINGDGAQIPFARAGY